MLCGLFKEYAGFWSFRLFGLRRTKRTGIILMWCKAALENHTQWDLSVKEKNSREEWCRENRVSLRITVMSYEGHFWGVKNGRPSIETINRTKP